MLCVRVQIALMGSIYEREQEHSANHRRAERAWIILGAPLIRSALGTPSFACLGNLHLVLNLN
eukprot:COSAG02_NODE_22805_length_739_cov_4.010740_1_plen_62_part_10